MGDSACLVHGFSYASAIPNDSEQGNPIHALGESISFGRYMTESLSWDKWSTFSHNKYVEEAERYAKPGSVAQKKAFFEAHYKRIAAQKAAALLEQENGAKMEENKIEDVKEDVVEVEIGKEKGGDDDDDEDLRKIQVDDVKNNEDRVSVSENNNKVVKIDKSLVKNSVVKEDDSLETSKKKRSNGDSMTKKRSSSKSNSLSVLMKETISPTKKTENTMAPTTYPAATPQLDRMKTPSDPSGQGSKRTGPKWRIWSSVCFKSLTARRKKLQSPASCVPSREERTAKRTQKLGEQFNATGDEKMQIQKTFKEKTGKELRILRCCFCFKAHPLHEFNKETETPKKQMKMMPAEETQKAVPGRNTSNKKQGTVSMPSPPPPPPPPPPIYLAKNSGSKTRNNVLKESKFLADSLPERNTHENASPNIQQ